jgi:hypothetical protein
MKVLNVLFKITLALSLIALGTFTIMCFWSWFIVPFGVKPIGFAHALGLSMIVSYLQHRQKMVFNPDVVLKRPFLKVMKDRFTWNFIGLGMGYIVSQFI